MESTTKTPVQIRFATPHDLSWCQAHDPHAYDGALHRLIRDQQVLIAESAGEPVGMLRFQYIWTTRPFISKIWVEPHHRRQGVALSMCLFFEQLHIQRGDEYILSSTELDNPLGLAWHRNMGFEECGVWVGINKRGVGELFYRKNL